MFWRCSQISGKSKKLKYEYFKYYKKFKPMDKKSNITNYSL